MKLTIIGAGGLRTPLFVEAAARKARAAGLAEVCLFDIDAKRLEASSTLSRFVAGKGKGAPKLTVTTDPRRAIRGADFVVTTIRVGLERGRVHDEKVAIGCGAIGQETTGPGGFAMALRSIPAILGYAREIERLAPEAWLLNFTNPAGLVVQALRDEGFERTIGICDSAENPAKYASAHLGVPPADIAIRVFGLNHLSFAPSVVVKGREQAAKLIADDAFLRRYFGLFDPAWIREHGVFPNEYLYYYLYPDHALAEMRGARQTRGEQVAALSGRFFRDWDALPRPIRAEAARPLYDAVLGTRHGTYMNYAWERTGAERPDLGREVEVEGYAGVALGIMQAMATRKTARIAVNVPNRLPDGKPAIPGLAASDVVEVSCTLEKGRVVPDRFERVAAGPLALVQAVKRYEVLTCAALRSRRSSDALDALAAHPLVGDRDVAEMIWNGYRRVHGASLGEWA